MKLKAPFVSVIIPVYNVAEFLPRCLDSILAQTLKNFEVILINDGSTDSSLDILSRYASKYDNFILIDKKNEGVTRARNLGISMAKGEYLSFVDSDDYVSPRFLQSLYSLAKSTCADIACCNYYKHNMETGRKYTYPLSMPSGIYTKQKALRLLINDTRVKYYIWNKLFRRAMIMDNNITFPKICFEDTEFCTEAFYHANKIAITRQALYSYCKHKNSTISKMKLHEINDYLLALASTRNFLEKKHSFQTYKKSYFTHSLRIFWSTIFLIIDNQGLSGKTWSNILRAGRAVTYYNSKRFKTEDDILNSTDIVVD